MYWLFSATVWVFIFYVFLKFDRSSGPSQQFGWFFTFLVLSLVPKLIILAVLFSEDLIRLLAGFWGLISNTSSDEFLPDRRKFVSQTALVLSALPFIGVLHGVFFGKYRFRVLKHTLEFDDLPESFDGLTITQISDIHSGSFDNAEKIEYAVNLVNEQQSDLLLFTGDLVNNRSDEMDPWIETFAKLKAPMGKFSILGNHDYGDYVEWPTEEAKQANLEKLYEVHKKIGFNLLLNENVRLQKGQSHIDLIGVENWGKGFAQHGDLKKATENLSNESFKILMSHDPSHFDEEIKKFGKFIHLTLSGHTHGMQFGIEIPGFIKWSPVSLRYKKWAGMYQELGRYLHVNRGFGFLAFPGRAGIWPEITVITLKREPS